MVSKKNVENVFWNRNWKYILTNKLKYVIICSIEIVKVWWKEWVKIVVLKDGDEEYFVMVTKDFYETYVPFEKEDYE